MMIRIMGAAMVIAGSAGVGFSLIRAHKAEEKMLKTLISILQEMEWELKYRITPLPELCLAGSRGTKGPLGDLFRTLSTQLEQGDVSDISRCMNGLVSGITASRRVRQCLWELGSCLGRYDLEGQLQGLAAVRSRCRRELEELMEGGHERLRCFQTLSVCAGVALAILLI